MQHGARFMGKKEKEETNEPVIKHTGLNLQMPDTHQERDAKYLMSATTRRL